MPRRKTRCQSLTWQRGILSGSTNSAHSSPTSNVLPTRSPSCPPRQPPPYNSVFSTTLSRKIVTCLSETCAKSFIHRRNLDGKSFEHLQVIIKSLHPKLGKAAINSLISKIQSRLIRPSPTGFAICGPRSSPTTRRYASATSWVASSMALVDTSIF